MALAITVCYFFLPPIPYVLPGLAVAYFSVTNLPLEALLKGPLAFFAIVLYLLS